MPDNAVISKTKYLAGLQCPKLLWHHFNRRDAFPPVDAATQAIFDAGHVVGDLAKRLYPDGVEVPMHFTDLERTASETKMLLAGDRPIFEASFLVDGGYCRADILVPVGDGAWDLYEVKSSTKVKPVNIHDMAFQSWLAVQSGVTLRRLNLTHIDTTYVRRGDLQPAGLLQSVDITDDVRLMQAIVPSRLADMHAEIAGDCPDTPIGKHCNQPYKCDLWPQCTAFLPERPVTELHRFGHKAFAQIEAGVTDLRDVPATDLNAKQTIQQTATTTGEPHTDREALGAWLDGLAYPLHCFDFETAAWTVPQLDGTHPYQAVPFQFSLHVIERAGGPVRHEEYLAEDPVDPRPALIEALRGIGPIGDILAYHASYEQRILRELARNFPEHEHFLLGLVERFKDLESPFLQFWHHHPDQHGRTSIKYVLPALTGVTYNGMLISDGNQAQREFVRVVFGDVDEDEKQTVLDGLRDYCRQDTQALVDILGVLARLA
jgi:hypothetical protein